MIKKAILGSKSIVNFWVKVFLFQIISSIIPIVLFAIETKSMTILVIVGLIISAVNVVFYIWELIKSMKLIFILKNLNNEISKKSNETKNYFETLMWVLIVIFSLILLQSLSIILPNIFSSVIFSSIFLILVVLILKIIFYIFYKKAKNYFEVKI